MIVPRPARLRVLDDLGSAAGREPDLELLPVGPPEGYRLDTTGPTPRIRAQDAAGVAYALTSLGQLPVVGGRLPAVVIEDRPRYPWRGVRLDAVTRLVPVDSILARLDDLAALKLNRLHLHLAGPEARRLELDAWAAPLADEHYTREDLRRIVEHAAARHIVVVPGIEFAAPNAVPAPGDARAAAAADVVDGLVRAFPGDWVHLSGDAASVERAAAVLGRLGRQVVGRAEPGAARLPVGSIGHYRGPSAAPPADVGPLVDLVARDGWAIISPGEFDGSPDWDPAEVVAGVGEDRIVGTEAQLTGADDAATSGLREVATVAWSPRDDRARTGA